jgi:hypothetical protein
MSNALLSLPAQRQFNPVEEEQGRAAVLTNELVRIIMSKNIPTLATKYTVAPQGVRLDLDQELSGIFGAFYSPRARTQGTWGGPEQQLSSEEAGVEAVSWRSLRPWESCAVCLVAGSREGAGIV